MKKILIYFPYNQRTVEQQSVMKMLHQKGHVIFLLTLSPEGYLHQYVRALGVKAFASPVASTSGPINILRNAQYLARFCKKNKIDIILAHQQVAALPMILASAFIKAKKVYVRHNADEDYLLYPVKAAIMNRFINTMLRNIVAPSAMVYQYMVQKEKVSPRKIRRINYGYDFSQYEMANEQQVQETRKKYACDLLVISIARMVPAKRHQQMFEAVRSLREKGLNIKMLCLGNGVLLESLQQWIYDNHLEQHIRLEGLQPNIFDYLTAGDILLHLSETEASNSVVKEAGLAGKPVIVCDQVGDFGDYIIHGQNGFLVNKNKPVKETVAIIEKYYSEKESLKLMGNNLCQTILQQFDIGQVAPLYDDLLASV